MKKFTVAYVCVHNSCRSQMAEALTKLFASDVFVPYSAGTETKPQINQDAVRLVKDQYQYDMNIHQHSKLLDDIPSELDLLITMGCNVECPFIPCQHREDWGLDDPTGQPDHVFLETIQTIKDKIEDLKQRVLSKKLELK